MGIDEQDAEIGRLVREKRAKERELACLESRRVRFLYSIRDNVGKLMLPLDDAQQRDGKTLIFDGGNIEIEWLNLEDMVKIMTETRKLRRDIEDMKRRLEQM